MTTEEAEKAPKLGVGMLAPWFIGQTADNPAFQFHTTAGRLVLLAFLGSSVHAPAAALLAQVSAHADLFDGERAAFFGVTIDAADRQRLAQAIGPGVRFVFDEQRLISGLYGRSGERGSYRPLALLLDRSQRVLGGAPVSQAEPLFALLKSRLDEGEPPVADHAPILVAPRILDGDLCRRLIEHYHAGAPEASGFMRERNGRTFMVSDLAYKSRKDAGIEDAELRAALQAALRLRLLPLIERAWGWRATRVERYIVARYAADEEGRFRPHRDNMTKGTAHRKFAVSINLNDDYDGGDLRFPEFGPRTYRPPVGGAVVFGCRVLHEATPMTRGERFATLPFLYDEQGAELRARNLQFVDEPKPQADAEA